MVRKVDVLIEYARINKFNCYENNRFCSGKTNVYYTNKSLIKIIFPTKNKLVIYKYLTLASIPQRGYVGLIRVHK